MIVDSNLPLKVNILPTNQILCVCVCVLCFLFSDLFYHSLVTIQPQTAPSPVLLLNVIAYCRIYWATLLLLMFICDGVNERHTERFFFFPSILDILV